MEYIPYLNDAILIAKPLQPVVWAFQILLGLYVLFCAYALWYAQRRFK